MGHAVTITFFVVALYFAAVEPNPTLVNNCYVATPSPKVLKGANHVTGRRGTPLYQLTLQEVTNTRDPSTRISGYNVLVNINEELRNFHEAYISIEEITATDCGPGELEFDSKDYEYRNKEGSECPALISTQVKSSMTSLPSLIWKPPKCGCAQIRALIRHDDMTYGEEASVTTGPLATQACLQSGGKSRYFDTLCNVVDEYEARSILSRGSFLKRHHLQAAHMDRYQLEKAIDLRRADVKLCCNEKDVPSRQQCFENVQLRRIDNYCGEREPDIPFSLFRDKHMRNLGKRCCPILGPRRYSCFRSDNTTVHDDYLPLEFSMDETDPVNDLAVFADDHLDLSQLLPIKFGTGVAISERTPRTVERTASSTQDDNNDDDGDVDESDGDEDDDDDDKNGSVELPVSKNVDSKEEETRKEKKSKKVAQTDNMQNHGLIVKALTPREGGTTEETEENTKASSSPPRKEYSTSSREKKTLTTSIGVSKKVTRSSKEAVLSSSTRLPKPSDTSNHEKRPLPKSTRSQQKHSGQTKAPARTSFSPEPIDSSSTTVPTDTQANRLSAEKRREPSRKSSRRSGRGSRKKSGGRRRVGAPSLRRRKSKGSKRGRNSRPITSHSSRQMDGHRNSQNIHGAYDFGAKYGLTGGSSVDFKEFVASTECCKKGRHEGKKVVGHFGNPRKECKAGAEKTVESFLPDSWSLEFKWQCWKSFEDCCMKSVANGLQMTSTEFREVYSNGHAETTAPTRSRSRSREAGVMDRDLETDPDFDRRGEARYTSMRREQQSDEAANEDDEVGEEEYSGPNRFDDVDNTMAEADDDLMRGDLDRGGKKRPHISRDDIDDDDDSDIGDGDEDEEFAKYFGISTDSMDVEGKTMNRRNGAAIRQDPHPMPQRHVSLARHTSPSELETEPEDRLATIEARRAWRRASRRASRARSSRRSRRKSRRGRKSHRRRGSKHRQSDEAWSLHRAHAFSHKAMDSQEMADAFHHDLRPSRHDLDSKEMRELHSWNRKHRMRSKHSRRTFLRRG